MNDKIDSVYLSHISDAIQWIETYCKGLNKKEFIRNHLVQDGVIRQIEIIGEATKKLSQKLRNKYSEIPWKDIAGMRDKLIHDYMGVDIDSVWETVKNDIPAFKSSIKAIITKEITTPE